jgi:hypothetical protein
MYHSGSLIWLIKWKRFNERKTFLCHFLPISSRFVGAKRGVTFWLLLFCVAQPHHQTRCGRVHHNNEVCVCVCVCVRARARTKHPCICGSQIWFFSLFIFFPFLCVLFFVLYYFDFPWIFTPSWFSCTSCKSLTVPKLRIGIKLGCRKFLSGNRDVAHLDCPISAILSVSYLKEWLHLELWQYLALMSAWLWYFYQIFITDHGTA